MQFMMMCCIEEKRWEALPAASRDAIMRDYGAWVAEMERQGKHVATAKLAPSASAQTLRVQGGRRHVVDGPFAETKEQFGGLSRPRMPRPRRRPRDGGADPDPAAWRRGRGPRGGAHGLNEVIEAVYRDESRRVLATLIRLLGDFDRAEEAMHEAFAAAVEQWPRDGVPANPRAWLVSAARFKGIDAMRRNSRIGGQYDTVLDMTGSEDSDPATAADEAVEDDRLRLIFTCCHPALAPDAQVAMTLREVCGLSTEEIASAFLVPASTLAQRIVRAKTKIRDAKIPYEIPSAVELPERLDAVLRVIYLVFNEGYAASSGDALTRADLSAEAIRLARLLVELQPEPEALGLLALMLLQDSRRAARTSEGGDIILLEQQDRSLWNRAAIEEGLALGRRALASRRFGPYTLQAAIAAAHAEAGTAAGDGLEPHRRDLQPPARGRAFAGHRAEPGGGDRDARRARGRSHAHRRDPRARRARGLPAGARGARRPLPQARPHAGSARVLPPRARPDAAGCGTPVHRAPARGAAV